MAVRLPGLQCSRRRDHAQDLPSPRRERSSTTTPVAGFERINDWEEGTERHNLCSHTNPRKLSAAHTTWTLVAAQLSATHNPTPSTRTPLAILATLVLEPSAGARDFPATQPCVPPHTGFRVPRSLTGIPPTSYSQPRHL
jgi:hypothetical protein